MNNKYYGKPVSSVMENSRSDCHKLGTVIRLMETAFYLDKCS